MPKRLLGATAITATVAALALPAVSSAGIRAGEKTFQQTFPVASHLCTEVAAGKRPHLKSVAAAVAADCAGLQTNFTAAQTTVITARTTFKTQKAADLHTIALACPKPHDGAPACVSARHTQHAAISVLRAQMLAAVHLYYKTIETDRRAFWAAIKALRPARHLAADKPIKVENS
jgi:hypothetical protein